MSYLAQGDVTAEEARAALLARWVEKQKALGKTNAEAWAVVDGWLKSGNVGDPWSPCRNDQGKNICTADDVTRAKGELSQIEAAYPKKAGVPWVVVGVAVLAIVVLTTRR